MKALWMTPLFATALFAARPALRCDDLAAHSFGDEVKIRSASLIAATETTPEHCDVRGVIWPEAGFAIKLPTEWNDRFEMVGNGGTAGTISMAALDAACSTATAGRAAIQPIGSQP